MERALNQDLIDEMSAFSIEQEAALAERNAASRAAIENEKSLIGKRAQEVVSDTARYNEKYLASNASDIAESENRDFLNRYLKAKDAATTTLVPTNQPIRSYPSEAPSLIEQAGVRDTQTIGSPKTLSVDPEVLKSDFKKARSVNLPSTKVITPDIEIPKRVPSRIIELIKRHPKVAAALGITGATALGLNLGRDNPDKNLNYSSSPLQFKEATTELPRSVESSSSTESTDNTTNETTTEPSGDAFRDAISQVESSGGINTDHLRKSTGIHKGDKAFGDIGLMPNTAKMYAQTLINQGDKTPELRAIIEAPQGSDIVNSILEKTPDLYDNLKDVHFNNLLDKSKGDALKAAHAHYYGEAYAKNRGISDDKFNPLLHDKDGYLTKFMRVYQGKEDEPQRMLAKEEIQPESLPISKTSPTQKVDPKPLSEIVESKYNQTEAYRDAQDASAMQAMMGRLGKAGAQIGSGIAGGVGPGVAIAAPKVDTSVFDEITKDADSHVKQFAIEKQIKEEAEKKDPNSPVSIAARKLAKSVLPDINIPENVSAFQLLNSGFDPSKMAGAFVGFEKQRRGQEFVKGEREKSREFKTETIENKKVNQLDKDAIKYVTKAQERGVYNPSTLKGKSNIKTQEDLIVSAGKVESALDNGKSGGKLTPQDLKDIAIAYARMLSPNTPVAQGILKDIEIGAFENDWGKFVQRLTGKPYDSKTAKNWDSHLRNVIDREKLQASSYILGEMTKSHKALVANAPNQAAKDRLNEMFEEGKARYQDYVDRFQEKHGSLSTTALDYLSKSPIRVSEEKSMSSSTTKNSKSIPVPPSILSNPDAIPGKGIKNPSTGKKYIINEDGKTMREL